MQNQLEMKQLLFIVVIIPFVFSCQTKQKKSGTVE